MIKIELYNTETWGISTYEMFTDKQVLAFVNNKRRMVFVLKGYKPDSILPFATYVSYRFENCINRLLAEQIEDDKLNVKNKYIITLEEGY